MTLSPEADLDALAQDTEGYSGADLQALVYNAQLEVIHETMTAIPASGSSGTIEDDTPIEYKIIGGPPGSQTVKSRAEEAAFQQRVCSCP